MPFATSRANSRPATLESCGCNPRGHDVQRFWRAMSAERQTRRCAVRVGKLLDLRPVVQAAPACERPAFAPLRAGDLNWQARLAPARNCPHSLRKRIVSDTLPADSAPDCLRAPSPVAPQSWHYVLPSKSPINGFALARLCRGIESAQFNFGFADGWHEGCEPAGLHKSHYLQSRPIAVSRSA